MATTSPRQPAYWLTRLFGEDTAAGIRVSDRLALSETTVFSATRNLAEDVGSVPCPVYAEDDDGNRGDRLRNHPVHRILNREANPEMAAVTFRETIQGHAVLRGNGYSEIEFDQVMRPRALWPLDPRHMRLVRAGRDVVIAGAPDGQLVYEYTLPSGQRKLFHPSLIHHVRGFGGNGLQGYSFLIMASETIAKAIAERTYSARFFANDATPQIVLKHQLKIEKAKREELRADWEDAHRPLSHKHRMAILDGGLELEKIGVNPEEAQLVETRKLSRAEISEWIRMPPDKVGDFERMTFSNAEHSDIFYVKYTVRAWWVRWDQESNRKLLTSGELAEHLADGFLRGDTKTRSEYYQQGFAGSNLIPNEARRLENRPPSDAPGAGELWFPLAMKPASAFDQHGMTMLDKANAVATLVRAGYEPAAAATAFGLPDVAHSGLVPITVQVDPSTLVDPATGQPPAQGAPTT